MSQTKLPPAYVINLDSRPDRWEQVQAAFAEVGDPSHLRRFQAKMSQVAKEKVVNGRIGCLLSHRGVVARAKEENLESVLVLEDDVVFSPELMERFDEAMSFIEDKEWDILYLGQNTQGPMLQMTEHCYRVSRALAAHALIIHRRCYDKILNVVPNNAEEALEFVSHHKAMDRFYSDHISPAGQVFAVWPHVVNQRDDYSDIEGKAAEHVKQGDPSLRYLTKSRASWLLWYCRWFLWIRPTLRLKQVLNPIRKRRFYATAD